VAAGFILHIPGFAWMGVSIVLLGVIVSLAMKVNHLIHLMKKAGLWDPEIPKKLKKHEPEKSASELIEKERKKAETIVEVDEAEETKDKEDTVFIVNDKEVKKI
jgi:hypothetical protein